MVKLVFNPSDKNEIVVESKTSKKRDVNLNPFKNHEYIEPENVITKKSEYEPTSVKDLVGLEICAYILNNWYLSSLKNEMKKMLLLIGPVGCGKSSLIELYCKENSIQLYTVKTTETIKTKKDLLKDIISFTIYTNFFVKNKCNKLILIDEYQNGQSDLLSISDINNLNFLRSNESKEENKKELILFLKGVCDFNLSITMPPILIISADSKGSKLSDIKKTNEVFYINEIPFSTIKAWIKPLFIKSFTEQILNDIIKKCKSDKRLILYTLEFLKNEKTNVSSFIDSFYKDIDINNFDFMDLLFDNIKPIEISEIFKIYDTDGFLLSNLVFENYLDYNQDMHAVAKSIEAISLGETIFSDTYDPTKVFIPEAHCINALCIPSYYSRDDRINKNLRTSCFNNRFNIYLNNKKIINKINENKIIPIDIFDIYTLKNFLNEKLLKTKKLSELHESFLKNITGSLTLEKMELIYKHFSDFSGKELKSKNFTLKFKDKLKKINNLF
jgi:hypothetical protein